MNAESQLHWCGYRVLDGRVDAPSQFSSRTRRAPSASLVQQLLAHRTTSRTHAPTTRPAILRHGRRPAITRFARCDRRDRSSAGPITRLRRSRRTSDRLPAMDARVEDEQFEDWVLEAIDALPPAFRERLGSVAIIVEEWPTDEQLQGRGARPVRALQRRPAQRARRRLGTDAVADHDLPGHDRAPRQDAQAMRAQVIDTVHHEIAHHFGISDARLQRARAQAHRQPGRRLTVDARILLVEDDASIREIDRARACAGAGFAVDDGGRRRGGPGAHGARRAAGPRAPRRDAPGHPRSRGLPPDPREQRDTGRDPDRGRRHGGRGARPGGRRGRLRAQTVRNGGARRASAGRHPARGARRRAGTRADRARQPRH